jgi:hypothetical protein
LRIVWRSSPALLQPGDGDLHPAEHVCELLKSRELLLLQDLFHRLPHDLGEFARPESVAGISRDEVGRIAAITLG